MDQRHSSESEQAKLWNGYKGRAWIEVQDLMNRMYRPLEEQLTNAVVMGQRVLDVGCGTGSMTRAVARQLGVKGYCVGVDISAPIIEVAREHAKREGSSANFLCADAQSHAFEPASFDFIISRFGVMFFDQPVTAFTNLRRAARQGAKLRIIVWRSAADNPFMTTAEHAAAPLLPHLPPRRPDEPGQFALADKQRLSFILKESGWLVNDIQPLDVKCVLSEQELVDFITHLGPVALALQEEDELKRNQIIAKVCAAFNPYRYDTEIRYTAACWLVSARVT